MMVELNHSMRGGEPKLCAKKNGTNHHFFSSQPIFWETLLTQVIELPKVARSLKLNSVHTLMTILLDSEERCTLFSRDWFELAASSKYQTDVVKKKGVVKRLNSGFLVDHVAP